MLAALLTVVVILFLGCPVVDTSLNVIYQANENTGGAPPNDTRTYNQGDEVTVLGNTASLVRLGYTFDGWNTQTDGNGTNYTSGEKFTMPIQSITLYAKWTPVIGIKALAGGSGFSYILQTDGSLWTTGFNGSGQLGNGTSSSSPTAIKIMDDVKAISAGQSFAMILLNNGDLYATGDNSDGQLGTGDNISVNTPVRVKQGIASVDCGTYYTMAIDTQGTLWGTGSNGISGVLGNDSTEDALVFTEITVPGDAIVTSVSAGERHTLLVTDDGSLYAIGDSNYGKLGRPYSSSNVYSRTPILVNGVSNIRSASAGNNHSMVVTEDNELFAFGAQKYGALGNGVDDFDNGISVPFKVVNDLLLINGIDSVQEVFTGDNNTLILRTDGTLLAVGSDYSHMLGDEDNSTACHTEIFEIAQDVTTAGLSGAHSLYGSLDGTAWGAGYNYTSTHNGIVPSTLGQGSQSDEDYNSFVSIPLIED